MNPKFLKIGAPILILAAALAVRVPTLWLPHNSPEENDTAALAMKWDKTGLRGYNLEGVHFNSVKLSGGEDWGLTYPLYTEEKSVFLTTQSPLLPFLLSYSHRYLAKQTYPFFTVSTNLGIEALHVRPKPFLEAQLWATALPLSASLLLILLIFLFSKKTAAPETALLATFIFAMNPLDILSASSLWSANLAALFLFISVTLFARAYEEGSTVDTFIAGLFWGLAILAESVLVLTILPLALWVITRRRLSSGQALYFFIAPFLAGGIFIAGHWFIKIFEVYGNPFYGWTQQITTPKEIQFHGLWYPPFVATAFLLLIHRNQSPNSFTEFLRSKHLLIFLILFTFFLSSAFVGAQQSRALILSIFALIALPCAEIIFEKWKLKKSLIFLFASGLISVTAVWSVLFKI